MPPKHLLSVIFTNGEIYGEMFNSTDLVLYYRSSNVPNAYGLNLLSTYKKGPHKLRSNMIKYVYYNIILCTRFT